MAITNKGGNIKRGSFMASILGKTRHYPQPLVSGWSMRRLEKLNLDIMIRGNFIVDNELNSALSRSFLNSTGAHHRSSLDPRKQ